MSLINKVAGDTLKPRWNDLCPMLKNFFRLQFTNLHNKLESLSLASLSSKGVYSLTE
jgi:hypothetical protein